MLDSLKNFKADAIILGHADSVTNETLAEIKDKNKNLKICQWFLDPVGKWDQIILKIQAVFLIKKIY